MTMTTTPHPTPVGVWFTRTDHVDDPDNIRRDEMTLVAIAPKGHIADSVTRMVYDWKRRTTAEMGDDPTYVLVVQHPTEGEWIAYADDMANEPNTLAIEDALADYLSAVTGGSWNVAPDGGEGSRLEAVGVGSRGQSATLSITDGYNQPPILGWDNEAVISFHDEDDDDVIGYAHNRTRPLSPIELVTEVLRVAHRIGFTFTA